MSFPSLIQYGYQGGIFLLPVTELSLTPAILVRKERNTQSSIKPADKQSRDERTHYLQTGTSIFRYALCSGKALPFMGPVLQRRNTKQEK